MIIAQLWFTFVYVLSCAAYLFYAAAAEILHKHSKGRGSSGRKSPLSTYCCSSRIILCEWRDPTTPHDCMHWGNYKAKQNLSSHPGDQWMYAYVFLIRVLAVVVAVVLRNSEKSIIWSIAKKRRERESSEAAPVAFSSIGTTITLRYVPRRYLKRGGVFPPCVLLQGLNRGNPLSLRPRAVTL